MANQRLKLKMVPLLPHISTSNIQNIHIFICYLLANKHCYVVVVHVVAAVKCLFVSWLPKKPKAKAKSAVDVNEALSVNTKLLHARQTKAKNPFLELLSNFSALPDSLSRRSKTNEDVRSFVTWTDLEENTPLSLFFFSGCIYCYCCQK